MNALIRPVHDYRSRENPNGVRIMESELLSHINQELRHVHADIEHVGRDLEELTSHIKNLDEHLHHLIEEAEKKEVKPD